MTSTYYVVLELPFHQPDPNGPDDRSSIAAYIEVRIGDGAVATVYATAEEIVLDESENLID